MAARDWSAVVLQNSEAARRDAGGISETGVTEAGDGETECFERDAVGAGGGIFAGGESGRANLGFGHDGDGCKRRNCGQRGRVRADGADSEKYRGGLGEGGREDGACGTDADFRPGY